MSKIARSAASVLVVVVASTAFVSSKAAIAVESSMVDRETEAALKVLYDTTPAARELADKARGILVFPNIVRAGFLFGAQYGDGELIKDGRPAGYYNITAVSYGLQAGIQAFGYVMFLMTDSAMSYLDRSGGWEIGVGPTVAIVDAGMAKTLTTSTLQSDIYGFVFGQKGLMVGVGVQGSKITRVEK